VCVSVCERVHFCVFLCAYEREIARGRQREFVHTCVNVCMCLYVCVWCVCVCAYMYALCVWDLSV